MTTTMRLDAIAPAYLEAKADVAEARKRLRGLEMRPKNMETKNAGHANEVAEKERTGSGPLITNGQALRMGSGSGYEIVYSRCRCSGFPPQECDHDPRESPHSPEDIADAEKAVKAARLFMADAEKKLAGTSSSFDCFENAREKGITHVWWPQDVFVDPRLRRWRGQPITPEEMTALGPHALNRGVQVGSIVEVPA